MSAVISPCGKYRYTLTREINPDEPQRLLFIMLNPSTADASQDDPTIRRCMSFADRLCCGTLEVVNCYAYRSTDPKILSELHIKESVGPDNWYYMSKAIARADFIILAWGANPVDHITKNFIKGTLKSCGKSAHHLGELTKAGHPRHPLYLAADAALKKFNWNEDPCQHEWGDNLVPSASTDIGWQFGCLLKKCRKCGVGSN